MEEIWEKVQNDEIDLKVSSFLKQNEMGVIVSNYSSLSNGDFINELPEIFIEDIRETLMLRNTLDRFIERHQERVIKKLILPDEVIKELRFVIQEGMTTSSSKK